MKKRILVAVIGVPLLILVLSFAPDWATMLLLAAMCAVGARELMQAAAGEKGKRLIPLTMVTAMLVPVAIYWSETVSASALPKLPDSVLGFDHTMMGGDTLGQNAVSPALSWMALLFVLFLFVYAILHYGKETAIPFADLTAAIFGGLVFPMMLSCLLRIRLLKMGELLVWTPLVVSFGSDTFALFGGMLCGRHKLAPHVSPKKTVEGGVGGLLGGVIGLALLLGIARVLGQPIHLAWWRVVLFGVLGSVGGQIGDLSFSVIKREFGVKDYGKLLPGHGGILDRFDSVTFVAPFIWLLLSML